MDGTGRAATPWATPTGTDTVITWAQLATVCWQGSVQARRAAHRAHGRQSCPTRVAPYGDHDLRGAGIHPACVSDECADLFHDVLAAVSERAARRWSERGNIPDEPVKYVAAMVPTAISDRARAQRVARGLPAKPGRPDGRAAAVIVRLTEAAPDAQQAAWLVALFRILRDYAAREGRASAAWPVDWLAQEKGRFHGGVRTPGEGRAAGEVRRDIALVLATATEVCGAEWVAQSIGRPLVAGVTPAAIPDDGSLADARRVEDQVIRNLFAREYLALRKRGLSAAAAFRAAARRICGEEPPAPGAVVLQDLRDLELAG